MKAQVSVNDPNDHDRITAGVPFVEAMARRMAASLPHSIDLGDLVQDGMIGLIDAAHRFDEGRGIKFETFAERRVRGAMIDAMRRECVAARGSQGPLAGAGGRPARSCVTSSEPSRLSPTSRNTWDRTKRG